MGRGGSVEKRKAKSELPSFLLGNGGICGFLPIHMMIGLPVDVVRVIQI